jgi:hypothetical protein
MQNNYSNYIELAKAIEKKPTWPRAMCFGDSWFQYPGFESSDIQKLVSTEFPSRGGAE